MLTQDLGTASPPANEKNRIAKLLEYDLDYTQMQDIFGDLTGLAAKIAGTEISLLNLIDSYTQWTVARTGIDLEQMPRGDSVCQFSLQDNKTLEIPDLREDERFRDKPYVAGAPYLRYYFGVPLRTSTGEVLGSLCVMNSKATELSSEKREMFQMIGGAVIYRLEMLHTLRQMSERIKIINHDIRSPLSGIVSLSQLIQEDAESMSDEELISCIHSIEDTGKSVLAMTEDVLKGANKDIDSSGAMTKRALEDTLTLNSLKQKLESLYKLQASAKNIDFDLRVFDRNAAIEFKKSHIIQMVGNLISNALKFTPPEGQVIVGLDLEIINDTLLLLANIDDTGPGIEKSRMLNIEDEEGHSERGSSGESGFGFGLMIVKRLVDQMNGDWKIDSTPGEGTSINLRIPV